MLSVLAVPPRILVGLNPLLAFQPAASPRPETPGVDAFSPSVRRGAVTDRATADMGDRFYSGAVRARQVDSYRLHVHVYSKILRLSFDPRLSARSEVQSDMPGMLSPYLGPGVLLAARLA